MDNFEALVAQILERDGYWVRQSVYVKLSKEEKRDLGKPSLPRPQIDLVAYSPKRNEIILYEVKSYLDSPGVKINVLKNSSWAENHFKLLTIPAYQKIVVKSLLSRLGQEGLITQKAPRVKFGLAFGNSPKNERAQLKEYVKQQGWEYLGPDEIVAGLNDIAGESYHNSPYSFVAKMIFRNPMSDERQAGPENSDD